MVNPAAIVASIGAPDARICDIKVEVILYFIVAMLLLLTCANDKQSNRNQNELFT